MSNPIQEPSISAPPAAQPTAQDPTTAGNVAQTHKTGGADSNTMISSLNDLKEKAPEVWEAMLKGIAQTIVNKMHDAQERLKKRMRESREGR